VAAEERGWVKRSGQLLVSFVYGRDGLRAVPFFFSLEGNKWDGTSQLAAALPNFAVNSVCPGWVRTDMGGPGAARSVEEGADTIVWLGTDAPQSLTGSFLRDRKPIPW
jgi:hypothetical protein